MKFLPSSVTSRWRTVDGRHPVDVVYPFMTGWKIGHDLKDVFFLLNIVISKFMLGFRGIYPMIFDVLHLSTGAGLLP